MSTPSSRGVAQAPTRLQQTSTRLQQVLQIGEQMRLAKIANLGDDTGTANKKPKLSPPPPPPPPPPTQVDTVPEDTQDLMTYVDYFDNNVEKVVPTVPVMQTIDGNRNKATERETMWLRRKYGNNWSLAKIKEDLKKQARRVLHFQIAPKVIEGIKLEIKAAKDLWNTVHLTLKDNGEFQWMTWEEVSNKLQELYGPGWKKALEAFGKEENKKKTDAVKKELYDQKVEQRKEYVKSRVEDRVKGIIEEENTPDASHKRKSHALLRHWFNRKGKNGTKRAWHKPYVSPEMEEARKEWATAQVTSENYNPANPPSPPLNLYADEDVKPNTGFNLPDSVDPISTEGGQSLWTYMRKLENHFKSNSDMNLEPSAKISINFSEQIFSDASFQEDQTKMLKEHYEDFVLSVDKMDEVPGAKDVALSYTVGSGPFNKYLLFPKQQDASVVQKFEAAGSKPQAIPQFASGPGGVGGNTLVGKLGPPDELHRLYKLLNRCPRLPKAAVFLRAVQKLMYLPHNYGRTTPIHPIIGTKYLNVSFMSTSTARPDEFTKGVLTTFYNVEQSCCMMAITCPEGLPVLPLVFGGTKTSAYANEKEVVLPPGLMFVYQGSKDMQVGGKTSLIYFYEVKWPSLLT